jgi:hypothetical protein
MNRIVERFLQDKILELIKDGFGVKIHNTPLVRNECGVASGYFDGEGKELEIAIKRPQKEWVPIFIHEYSHYTQWKDDCKVWRDIDKVYETVNLWSWLSGDDEYTDAQLERCKIATQRLEQDCDKRAVALIEQYNLPISKDHYIQSSNAYILFYNICIEQRKWYKKSPYSDPRINGGMPKKFISEKDFGKVPAKFNKLVVKEFLD